MPKRRHSPHQRKKKTDIGKLKKHLRLVQDELNKIQQESESSETSEYDSEGGESGSSSQPEGPFNQPEDQDFNILGIRPDASSGEGPPLHEEIMVRWNIYLRKGLTKEQREELMGRYKIPTNCKPLLPPQINNELQACLAKSSMEQDKFMVAVQQQLAHGLAAVGTVMGSLLPIPDQSEHLKTLADACHLFTNVHYAISPHRKF